jgi:hypothetical protein
VYILILVATGVSVSNRFIILQAVAAACPAYEVEAA